MGDADVGSGLRGPAGLGRSAPTARLRDGTDGGAGVETPPGRAPGVWGQKELVWKAVLKTHPKAF